jgi:uncharacterized membrane protein HdeD (DUF308 family)
MAKQVIGPRETQGETMSPSRETASIADYWWLFLVLGVLLIIAGLGAAVTLYIAAVTVQLLLGWLLVVGGVVYAVYSFLAKREEGVFLPLLASLVYVLFGVGLLVYPGVGAQVLSMLLGLFLLGAGGFKILLAWKLRNYWSWWWGVLFGLVSIGLGIYVLLNLDTPSALRLGVVLGIDLLLSGVTMLMLGRSLHHPRQSLGRAAHGTA